MSPSVSPSRQSRQGFIVILTISSVDDSSEATIRTRSSCKQKTLEEDRSAAAGSAPEEEDRRRNRAAARRTLRRSNLRLPKNQTSRGTTNARRKPNHRRALPLLLLPSPPPTMRHNLRAYHLANENILAARTRPKLVFNRNSASPWTTKTLRKSHSYYKTIQTMYSTHTNYKVFSACFSNKATGTRRSNAVLEKSTTPSCPFPKSSKFSVLSRKRTHRRHQCRICW